MSQQRNFYIVKERDTLSKIARENGTTIAELMKINRIKDPNKISRGQYIALRKEASCGVEALFLDRDRNPIEGIIYKLEYCNKTLDGKSEKNGKSQRVLTESPDDCVRVFVQRLNGTWKEVTTVISDVGNKLVTLVSGHLMSEAKTEKHPEEAVRKTPDPKEKPKPTHDPKKPPAPSANKEKTGPTTKATKTPDGKAIAIVEGDLPRLDEFLDPFNGELMTDAC